MASDSGNNEGVDDKIDVTRYRSEDDEALNERISVWEQRLAEPVRTEVVPLDELLESDIDALNFVGDPLAENFLRAVSAAGLKGADDIEALRILRAAGDPAAVAFWTAINHVPEFFDFERMRMIGGFSRRNFFAGPYFVAGALPFTYSDPNVAHVLDFGGGVAGRGNQVKRFRETLRGVVSVNDTDALRPGGSSWEHWVRVRLIHARVRRGVWRTGTWDNTFGLPVSALRIAGGSYVFASFVPQVYASLGATASSAELEAITRTWQWVTYVLGGPLDLIPADLAGQRHVDRMLIGRSIVLQSDTTGARLADDWFEACAKKGILGVRVPVWFVHALARRTILGGLRDHPDFASSILDCLEIRERPLADGIVGVVGGVITVLGKASAIGPVGRAFETVGDSLTSGLIARLELQNN